jgi:nucleoside-diphosphate-sugar epimerase
VRLLVTGGTGFIGSHLAEDARRRGAEVVVLGLTDRPEEQANARLLENLGVEVLPGSVTDAALCARAMEGVTHVYHLAVAMREAGMTDQYFEEINLGGTRHLLETASARGLQRFIYCSTIGIFGHRVPGITNEDSPLRPGNVYERTKVAAEAMARGFHAGAGLPVVILRPADVYGPRDHRLLKLFRGVAAGRFPLFGDGKGRRHMVFVDDVVAAFRLASDGNGALGQALIVAGPESCTLRELIDAVARAAGRKRFGWRLPLTPMLAVAAVVEDVCTAVHVTPPIYRRRMDFFHSDSAFDTSRARRVLGWGPKIHLNEGVARTLDAYRKAGLV